MDAILILKTVGRFLLSPLGVALVALMVLVGSHMWTYQSGAQAERSVWVQKARDQALKVEAATKAQKAASDLVIKELAKRFVASEARKARVEVVIQKVKTYVTQKADDQCTITRGFEWVHNVSLDPGLADRTPPNVDEETAIKVSDVAATVASNNAEAVQRGEIIEMWQEWYVKNKEIFEQYHRDTK